LRFDCIGFGALNTDHLYRVDQIARSGEERIIIDHEEHLGGSAANTIVGLSRLGHSVGYIGKLADDESGRYHLKNLADENVDTNGIVQAKTGRSGSVIGFVDSTGERTLYVDPGVNDTLESKDVDYSYASNSRFLHITSFVGELPFIAQKNLIKSLTSTLISFDPGELYSQKGLLALRPILKRSFVIFPNRQELYLLTGESHELGAKELLCEGVKIVAVKLGNDGCFVTNGKESYSVPALPTDVVDTTGAGDAFCTGFLHGLIHGKNIQECGRLGNLVASKKISKSGARIGLPYLQDLI
jgi:ribokinase